MTMPASAVTTTPFDPSAAVPDAYDVFCEACGYSLVGLTGDRCPECGQAFEPLALPFARVPWLHRRRIGRWRAYWRTVAMVAFTPRRFAAEVCRPVRVSADDARRFRVTTIWIATIAIALLMLVGQGTFILAATGPSLWPSIWMSLDAVWIAFGAIAFVGGMIAFHILLRLLTDMPVFIWKGLPSLDPRQLSPVHHYASAPLAFLPFIAAPVLLTAVVAASLMDSSAPIELALWAVGAGCSLWLWSLALILMRSASGASPRRVLLLAVYLPFHWFIMALMMLMVVTIFWGGEMFAFHAIFPHMRF